jgi:hypothetical protein
MWKAGLPRQIRGFQHHIGVDQAQPRVLESTRQATGNRKPHPPPQSHRPLIRGDDEIELHGCESTCFGLVE